MNQTVNGALPVFDELEQRDEAFNVYQYMLKLGSQAIGKLVLDMDWQHFTNADAYACTLAATARKGVFADASTVHYPPTS